MSHKVAILYNSSYTPSNNINEYIVKYSKIFESMNYTSYDLKNETEIREFAKTTLVNEYGGDESGGVTIISIIRENVEILLDEMYNNNLKSDQYPVVVVDILVTFFYDSEKPEVYKGHYFISSYVNEYDYDENALFVNYLDLKFGNIKSLATEGFMMMLIATRFLSNAFETVKTSNADQLRDELYRTTVNVPLGSLTISSRNIALNKIFLCQFNNDDYDIILNPYSSLDMFQFSPYVYI